jgi:4-hydroxy-4-methyl-2-oxoglutarate aldolase
MLSSIGDAGVGLYEPPSSGDASWPRVSDDVLQRVRALPGATPTGSDILDDLGLAMVADGLRPRNVHGVVAGHVHTIAYLPERRALSNAELRRTTSRLAHHTAFALARPGDILVIDARGLGGISVLGGMAAAAARDAGVSACIVDGGVRDLDEVREIGISLWSRDVTPRSGKWRLEAIAVDQPVMCGGVHIRAGDVAIADETGVCFLPGDVAEQALVRIVEVSEEERELRAREADTR